MNVLCPTAAERVRPGLPRCCGTRRKVEQICRIRAAKKCADAAWGAGWNAGPRLGKRRQVETKIIRGRAQRSPVPGVGNRKGQEKQKIEALTRRPNFTTVQQETRRTHSRRGHSIVFPAWNTTVKASGGAHLLGLSYGVGQLRSLRRTIHTKIYASSPPPKSTVRQRV